MIARFRSSIPVMQGAGFGSAAPVSSLELRTFDKPSLVAGMTSPCATALEISSLHTDDGLRLQDLETCRWRRELLDVWTTGSGRSEKGANNRSVSSSSAGPSYIAVIEMPKPAKGRRVSRILHTCVPASDSRKSGPATNRKSTGVTAYWLVGPGQTCRSAFSLVGQLRSLQCRARLFDRGRCEPVAFGRNRELRSKNLDAAGSVFRCKLNASTGAPYLDSRDGFLCVGSVNP
jgi:hypothetical protein